MAIFDATSIQRNLADMNVYTDLQRFLGDVDHDEQLSIFDATCIQRRLAEMDNEFWRDSVLPWKVSIEQLICYQQDRATYQPVIGVGCFLQIDAPRHTLRPDRYTLYINDELIQYKSTQRSCTYTFPETGRYTVTVHGYDVFGNISTYMTVITAIDAGIPIITDLEYDSRTMTVHAAVTGGAAPYEYRFAICRQMPPLPSIAPTDQLPTEPGVTDPSYGLPPTFAFDPNPDIPGTFRLLTDWVPDATVSLPVDRMVPYEQYLVLVEVRDREKRLAGQKTLIFDYFPDGLIQS